MRAVVLKTNLEFCRDWPEPTLHPGEALIRPLLTGICKTDLELVKGYMGFLGVLGHEFVGVVEDCSEQEWIGRRVVGEINCPPQGSNCQDPRHLEGRTVLGILGRDGVMAERFSLPVGNLMEVPSELSDLEAVFSEPLAAAYEIEEQLGRLPDSALVLGDGKLGTLCALALQERGCATTLVGKYPRKLEPVSHLLRTVLRDNESEIGANFPLVVDATGSPDGLAQALAKVRPRGTVILKTTVAAHHQLDLAPVVINEIQLLGSRCGRFPAALKAMAEKRVDPTFLVEKCYYLEHALEAFEHAARPGAGKILLDCSTVTP